ncbi:MAG: SIMPL domain-containing protein [Candidatus Hodarchaeota archaeon]
MKKYLLSIILLLSVLGVGAHASQLPDFPFVFAQGRGEIEVPPDIATVSFHVEEFNENATNALEVVRNRSAELITFFAEHKIKKEDIVAYEIDKKAVRERKDYKELKILGYEVSRRFSITLRDLSLYEQFIKKLLFLKNVVNINAEFDRTDRKKIEADLIAEASRNAREQAELMAKGFGVQLGSVFAISQRGFQRLATEFGVMGYEHGVAYKKRMVAKDFLFAPSTITLQNTVTAIFKLKGE